MGKRMAKSINKINQIRDGDLLIIFGLGITFTLVVFIFFALLSLIIEGSNGNSLEISAGEIFSIIKFTLLQSFLSVLFSLLLGLMVARALIYKSLPWLNSFLLSLSSVAFVVPTIVACIGIVKIWGGNGFLNEIKSFFQIDRSELNLYGLFGILLAHIFFNTPLYLRVFYNSLLGIPENYLRNAEQLKISGWNYFYILEWPFLRPALPGLTGLVFLQCFTSFSIILMLGGGPASSTLEVAIYNAVRFEFNLNSAATLSIIQICICVFIIALLRLFGNSKLITIQTNVFSTPRRWVTKFSFLKTVSSLFWIILFLLFVLSPILAIIYAGLNFDIIKFFFNINILNAIVTSITLAISSSIMTIILAWILAASITSLTLNKSESAYISNVLKINFINLIVILYIAVPAIVMGTGIFILLRDYVNYQILPIFIVIIANVLLSLPFAIHIIQSKMQQLNLKHKRICLSLGISGMNRFMKIDFPALRPQVGFAMGLSACLSIGDLSVIALFGNQNFQTLPWLLYQLMSSYRMKEAASISLLLLCLSLIFFYGIGKLIGGRNA